MLAFNNDDDKYFEGTSDIAKKMKPTLDNIAKAAEDIGYLTVFEKQIASIKANLEALEQTALHYCKEHKSETLDTYGAGVQKEYAELNILYKQVMARKAQPDWERRPNGWSPDDIAMVQKYPGYRPARLFHATDSNT